jgi:hypothetical protein
LSPVLLLTAPPTPPYSRKTRSSGAKRDDGKSAPPGLKPVSRQLKMKIAVQASTPNATTNTKRAVQVTKPNATTNTNVAEETMMSEVLEGTADNDFSQSREIGPVNSATVEVTAETIEVTVDDDNAEVNRKLWTIEALDLMEHGDGGDSDEEGFEFDYHNDAVRKRVTLCDTKTDATDNTVSDDDLDIEYIDDSVGEAWWHMRRPGANIPGAPDGWSPPGIPKKWSGYKPRNNSGAPTEEDIDNPGNWNLY